MSNDGEPRIENAASKGNVTLPHFNPTNTAHWTKMCSRAFQAYGVTDNAQQCYLILASLPNHLQVDAAENADTVQQLCSFIVKATSVPAQQRMKALLTEAKFGDRTPTQYLRHLRELVGIEGERDSLLIRNIFMERLPDRIAEIIAPPDEQTLDSIAEMADRIHTHMGKSTHVHTITPQINPNAVPFIPTPKVHRIDDNVDQIIGSINSIKIQTQSHKDTTMSLAAQLTTFQQQMQQQINSVAANLTATINMLQRQVSNLQAQLDANERGRHSYRSTSRPRVEEISNDGMCYYHKKFGPRATKCTQPCSYVNTTADNYGTASNIRQPGN